MVLARILREPGVGLTAYNIMRSLHDEDPDGDGVCPREIYLKTGINYWTIRNQVKRSDRFAQRGTKATLSPSGREMIAKIIKRLNES